MHASRARVHSLKLTLRTPVPAPPRPCCRPTPALPEYFGEGLLRRLLDRHDPTSRKLLQSTVFYVVPCM